MRCRMSCDCAEKMAGEHGDEGDGRSCAYRAKIVHEKLEDPDLVVVHFVGEIELPEHLAQALLVLLCDSVRLC